MGFACFKKKNPRINHWLNLQLSICIVNKQPKISFQSPKLLAGAEVFLFLYCIREIGCGGCTGWSKLQTDLWLCPFQLTISAVKYDLASAYQTYFPLTSGRCYSMNKRAEPVVVLPSVSSSCWSSGCAGSGTNELHNDFLRNMNNKNQMPK